MLGVYDFGSHLREGGEDAIPEASFMERDQTGLLLKVSYFKELVFILESYEEIIVISKYNF